MAMMHSNCDRHQMSLQLHMSENSYLRVFQERDSLGGQIKTFSRSKVRPLARHDRKVCYSVFHTNYACSSGGVMIINVTFGT